MITKYSKNTSWCAFFQECFPRCWSTVMNLKFPVISNWVQIQSGSGVLNFSCSGAAHPTLQHKTCQSLLFFGKIPVITTTVIVFSRWLTVPANWGKKRTQKQTYLCHIYFDLKVSQTNIWLVVSTHFFKHMLVNMGSSSPSKDENLPKKLKPPLKKWVFFAKMVVRFPNKPMGFFPTKNDQHLGCEMGGNPPFKETPRGRGQRQHLPRGQGLIRLIPRRRRARRGGRRWSEGILGEQQVPVERRVFPVVFSTREKFGAFFFW